MDTRAFAASPSGRMLRAKTGYDAFVPNPLPPGISWQARLVSAVERAGLNLGHLSGALDGDASTYLPILLTRDAVGAIRAEGKATSVAEFFETEAAGARNNVPSRLAGNYAAAFEYARRRLVELPLSLRLIRELHHALLDGVVDPRTAPGEFRRSQNWLGSPGCTLSGAAFVPPPTEEMRGLLDNWERFLHEKNELPALVRLSLTHCQYLIMQPFLDMNILASAVIAPVILHHLGVTSMLLPVFGRWLERHSASLQQHMIDVCARGCWEEWLTWYLHGVADAAWETSHSVSRLRTLHDAQRRAMPSSDETARVLDLLFEHPAVTPEWVAERGGMTPTEAANALGGLELTEFVHRRTSEQRTVYVATDVIAALETTPARVGDYPLPF